MHVLHELHTTRHWCTYDGPMLLLRLPYDACHVQVLRMGKVLHQYALCDFDAADEFLVAMHPALLEVRACATCHT